MEFLKLFIVALFVLFIGCGGYPSTPEEIAVNAIKAMANGDIEKLNNYFGVNDDMEEDTKAFVEKNLKSVVEIYSNMTKEKGGLKSVKVVEKIKKNEYEKIKILIKFADNSTKDISISIIEKNGKFFTRF